MRLSEIKPVLIANRKKIIAVICVLVLVLFSNCIIDGKIVCRFTTELNVHNLTEKDVDNIRGLYFLKKLTINKCETSDSGFLENKNFLTELTISGGNITDWSYLENCPKLKEFSADGKCTFNDLKCFSGLENLELIFIGMFCRSATVKSLDGLQGISKSLKGLYLREIEDETVLNLEKFTNLRSLDIEKSSLREIHVNSYLEYLNVSDNPNLRAVYLPVHYGTPETIYTDNSPYVNIIYE